MHRKIRAVVEAQVLGSAVDKAIEGLENAMDENILADGNLQTLSGEYTPLSPSTYFDDGRDTAGYKVATEDGMEELETALDHTLEHNNAFIFSIDERRQLTASPITTEEAYTMLKNSIKNSDKTYWVVAFDLRYDFDAVPHKPYEILDRDQ